MTFDESEVRFRELRARLQRGEPMSRAEFERQVSELAVVDDRGVMWEIHPHTCRWMYFDGAGWCSAIPPGRDQSTVIPQSELRATETMPSIPAQTHASTPAPLPGSEPMDHLTIPARILRPNPPVARTREWVPLALGAIVLFIGAIVIFFGGRTVLGVLASASPTPTQVKVVAPILGATHTAVPTIARLPAPVVTATVSPLFGTVIENRVNVRAAPSTQAKIVGKIQKDDVITLIGRSEDGAWFQVTIPGIAPPSWVFGETMKIANGDPNSLPLVKP